MTTPATWQKSSFSGGGEGNDCVELAATEGGIRLRESDTPASELATTPTPLTHLLHTLKSRNLTGH
ncbi:DUF397 domain-containing protein [Streptomyces sp. E11-3]|uniref:DUF397 domain-containing protein n=1 Tax=Streptomyces sp. E11-3 TaxID=3110112 RepID=UPI00397FE135